MNLEPQIRFLAQQLEAHKQALIELKAEKQKFRRKAGETGQTGKTSL